MSHLRSAPVQKVAWLDKRNDAETCMYMKNQQKKKIKQYKLLLFVTLKKDNLRSLDVKTEQLLLLLLQIVNILSLKQTKGQNWMKVTTEKYNKITEKDFFFTNSNIEWKREKQSKLHLQEDRMNVC